MQVIYQDEIGTVTRRSPGSMPITNVPPRRVEVVANGVGNVIVEHVDPALFQMEARASANGVRAQTSVTNKADGSMRVEFTGPPPMVMSGVSSFGGNNVNIINGIRVRRSSATFGNAPGPAIVRVPHGTHVDVVTNDCQNVHVDLGESRGRVDIGNSQNVSLSLRGTGLRQARVQGNVQNVNAKVSGAALDMSNVNAQNARLTADQGGLVQIGGNHQDLDLRAYNGSKLVVSGNQQRVRTDHDATSQINDPSGAPFRANGRSRATDRVMNIDTTGRVGIQIGVVSGDLNISMPGFSTMTSSFPSGDVSGARRAAEAMRRQAMATRAAAATTARTNAWTRASSPAPNFARDGMRAPVQIGKLLGNVNGVPRATAAPAPTRTPVEPAVARPEVSRTSPSSTVQTGEYRARHSADAPPTREYQGRHRAPDVDPPAVVPTAPSPHRATPVSPRVVTPASVPNSPANASPHRWPKEITVFADNVEGLVVQHVNDKYGMQNTASPNGTRASMRSDFNRGVIEFGTPVGSSERAGTAILRVPPDVKVNVVAREVGTTRLALNQNRGDINVSGMNARADFDFSGQSNSVAEVNVRTLDMKLDRASQVVNGLAGEAHVDSKSSALGFNARSWYTSVHSQNSNVDLNGYSKHVRLGTHSTNVHLRGGAGHLDGVASNGGSVAVSGREIPNDLTTDGSVSATNNGNPMNVAVARDSVEFAHATVSMPLKPQGERVVARTTHAHEHAF